MEALKYETLVRSAFGYPGKKVERSGDPAQMADTATYSLGDLTRIKIATGYSMEIFTTAIKNNKSEVLQKEKKRLDKFANRILKAKNLEEISNLIEEFNNTVINYYYEFNDGIMTLK
ncbi:MAG: hypothetical protein ABR980_11645 [Ignavibacteriaceae bacterium]|jgi:hypothetical protein